MWDQSLLFCNRMRQEIQRVSHTKLLELVSGHRLLFQVYSISLEIHYFQILEVAEGKLFLLVHH